MIVICCNSFCGHGFNMPNPGELLEVNEELGRHLISIGVAAHYETKVEKPPQELKKNGPSESSQADLAPAKKTRKSSRRSATK